MKRFHRPIVLSALALAALAGISAHGQVFTWSATGAGTTYDWNSAANWNPNTAFPNAAGAVANVNNDLAGAQTIRLRQNISIGRLNLGDAIASGASFAYTISNATGEAFALTFDSGVAGTAAQLNLSSTGIPANAINTSVILASDLSINFASLTAATNVDSPRLTFGGTGSSINLGDRTITVTGGFIGPDTANEANQLTFNSDLVGTVNSRVVNNGDTPIIIGGTKNFLGTFVLNGKAGGGSNTGSLSLTNGSIAAAAEVIVNGYLSAGATQNGGTLQVGSGTTFATNPGQRLTRNTITLNGGHLNAGGQPLDAAVVDRVLRDDLDVLDLNSGYSLVTLGSSSNSQRLLNIETLQRSPGASVFARAAQFGNPAAANATTMAIGNASTYLKGSGSSSGTNMSIIPWMLAANTNGSAASGSSFATHNADGVRALADAEYATSIAAGADQNVSTGTLGVPAADSSATINALRHPTSGTSTIGAGKTLIVASGGVIFTQNNGSIGASGDVAAGTLQFGTASSPAEGVVWSNGTNTNRISASISGSLGLTKSGTGTLVLNGDNSYTGLTYVGSGILQVGDGTFVSHLGLTGNVAVANGATLWLYNSDAIADSATLTLENFGLANGKLQLNAGINETVGGLFFNNSFAPAGTYGASGSGATFVNDTYFGGDGVLTVVPEPGSISALLGGIGVLLLSRRVRRSVC